MKKYRLIAIIITLLASTCNVYAKDKNSPEKKTVKVHKVVATEIYDTYKYPVSVESKHEREIYSEINGVVHDIHVTVGEWVKKDAVLMHLKPIGPEFAELTIKSSLAGQVTQIAKKTGSHVKKDELLIHIVDPKDLTIKIEIPEAELALLSVQQAGEAKFRSITMALPIVVTGISSLIEQTTGTATGQLDWDGPNFKNDEINLINKHVYPGMLGMVTFKVNQRNGITIPSQALLHEKSEDKVRLVKNGKASKKIIKLGKHLDGGMIEVTDGLQVGDMVVSSTGKYVKENEEVLVEGN